MKLPVFTNFLYTVRGDKSHKYMCYRVMFNNRRQYNFTYGTRKDGLHTADRLSLWKKAEGLCFSSGVSNLTLFANKSGPLNPVHEGTTILRNFGNYLRL